MKIVVLDGYALNPGDLSWERLEKLGEVKVYDRTPAERVLERIGDAEIVYTNKTVFSREIIEKIPKVKFIGVLATGYNVVDVVAAKEFGKIVTNVPAYSTNSVAQFTFALILELCHHVGEHSRTVKAGAWAKAKDYCFWNYPLIELADMTLGIIGYGKIGRAVAKIAVAMGMKVLFYNRSDLGICYDDIKQVSLDTLLRESDIISLHCPLFENTKGIINKISIEKMKYGAMIINTSRGPLINEKDLAEALNSGKLSGAAVDVLSSEPPNENNPLLSAKNCIITPHIAWAPRETRQRLLNVAIDNLEALLSGNPINVVS